ncbi:hypothetical protein AHF37_00127 [Paragonimus kellicotti]|nr:hypothetical protein AHF37_00127 [Paragonimus kellicotti]
MVASGRSSDAYHAVKYVYCVLDEISRDLSRLEDCPDSGLLPLLSRVESTFTYRHYQITQGLSTNLLSDLASWCFHRLLLIACRPQFSCHLNTVGFAMRKLALLLERHHLDTFISHCSLLLTVLNDSVLALERFDESDDQADFELTLEHFGSSESRIALNVAVNENGNNDQLNQTDGFLLLHCFPIRLTMLREAYHLVAVLCHTLSVAVFSFHTYAPHLVPRAFRTFELVIDLCDIRGKQRALEAVFQATTAIFTDPVPPPARVLAANSLTNSVVLALGSLNNWIGGRLHFALDVISFTEDVTALEQLTVCSLNWLSELGSLSVEQNQREPCLDLNSISFSAWYNKSLLSVCKQLLSSPWATQLEHGSLYHALLSYASTRISLDQNIDRSNADLINLDDWKKSTPELCYLPFPWANRCPQLPICINDYVHCCYKMEMLEVRIERYLSGQLRQVDPTSWKLFFDDLRLPDSMRHSARIVRDVWFRLSRLWGAFNSDLQLCFSFKERLVDIAAQTIKHATLSLSHPDKIVQATCDEEEAPGWFTTYATLRLITKSIVLLRALSNEDVLRDTLVRSLLDWLSTFQSTIQSQVSKGNSSILQSLIGPSLQLVFTISEWSSRMGAVDPNTLADLIGSLVVLCVQADTHADFWLQQLNCSLVISTENVSCLRLAIVMLRTLVRHLRQVTIPKHAALLLAHLSAKLICIQSRCIGCASLYCQNCPNFPAPLVSDEQTDEHDTPVYSLMEQFDLLNLFLEGNNLEGASEGYFGSLSSSHSVLMFYATYLPGASPSQWPIGFTCLLNGCSRITLTALIWRTHSLSCHVNGVWLIRILPCSINDVRGSFSHSIHSKASCLWTYSTPAIVGRIMANVAGRLSSTDLGNWLVLHSRLCSLLAVTPRQGPSSSLGSVAFDEYRITLYGALASCLAKRYIELLLLRPNSSTPNDSANRRASNDTASTISTNSLADLLTAVFAALCRLGLVHQYTHALYGAVYAQIDFVVKSLQMTSAHTLRLCRDKVALVVADHMEQVVTPAIDCLARLFQLDKTVELVSPLFIALMLRGNQESHLQIRQLVAEVPYIRPGQDYVSKIIQLCVLPETLVYIFTRTLKEGTGGAFRFSRIPLEVGASFGLRWVASRVLTVRDTQSGVIGTAYTKGPASADFLGQFVCGILAFFDNTLLDDDTMLEHRWIALRSLVVFIQLLGSRHVTRMRAKFMATLKICLRYKTAPFAKVVIKSWCSFIRLLEVDALRELLPDLGATLVALMPYGPDQVTDLFNYLFLEKKDELGDWLSCLFFLPRTPKLLTCQQILDDICCWRSQRSSNHDAINESQLRTLLNTWLSALTHSSRSVRRLALTAEVGDVAVIDSSECTNRLWGLSSLVGGLSTALMTSSSRQVDCINSRSEPSDSAALTNHSDSGGTITRNSAQLLGDLISALLEGLTRDTDEHMRLLYAQWLGSLGAIDPSRLCQASLKTNTDGILTTVYVNDRRFSFHILCELAKIYLRAASPKQLDWTTLAIQELLKFLRSEALKDTRRMSPLRRVIHLLFPGAELWNLFPEHLCDLFTPLLTSRYAIEAFTDWTNVHYPLISGSDSDMTFEYWIRLWSGSLSAHITSPHAFSLFRFCEPVVKTDAGFARLILEPVALQVLLDNAQSGITQLQTEVLAVLKEVAEAVDVDGGNPCSSDNLLLTTSLPEFTSPDEKTANRRLWKSWYSLAVQTVFGLLDYLRRWVREQKPVAQSGKQPDPPAPSGARQSSVSTVLPEAVKRVDEFLAGIPNLLQAKASLRCGGLARALLHWELAYGEDKVAQESAYHTGSSLTARSTSTGLLDSTTQKGGYRKEQKLIVSPDGLVALDGLLDTYALLRDTDGLAGVLAVCQLAADVDWASRTDPRTIKSGDMVDSSTVLMPHSIDRFSTLRALELENEGQLDMAAAAYEHSLASSELESTHAHSRKHNSVLHMEEQRLTLYSGLFRCELSDPARLHGLVERAGALIHHSQNEERLKTHSENRQTSSWALRLNAYRSEAAWRLSDWNTLRETTNLDHSNSTWSVELGKLFLAISDKHTSEWSRILSRLRLEQITELNAAALEGPGGYARAYETIARLSALSEVELISSLGESFRSQYGSAHSTCPTAASKAQSTSTGTLQSRSNLDVKTQLENVLSLLDSRLKMYQPTFHTLEPCGQFMAAYTCVLRAEAFGIPQALIERAKLLWQTDKRESAQACLDKGIPELYGTRRPDDSSTLLELNISHQQAKLLRVRYCEETSRFDFETTRRMYEEVCDLRDGCEEAHFRLARYVERACSLATVALQHDTLLKAALTHYGLALSYGSQFIYQSMPRLLCLWLDYGTDFVRRAGAMGPSAKNTTATSETRLPPDEKTFQEVQEIMRHNIQRIPAYQYYTALGQLLSRVCHEVPAIVNTLIDLVVRIFEAYPLQTIWFLMPLNDSTVRQRRERCQQIFSLVKSRQPQLSKFISDSIALCNHLRTICGLFMSADRRELRSFSLRQSQRPLTRLIENSDFSRILIPVHQQLVPNLLPPRARCEDVQRHWPFGAGPDQLVCLVRMDDTVEILGSQTKPKKMTWIGSDGRRYIIVAKPEDDLRKDSRLMELNGMINKFLAKNPDTRRRALQIRTYAVIPLSENGGLIEWVSNTEPFRTIITRLYNASGRPINWAAMTRVAPVLDDPLPVKRDKYLNKWLPMFPLVFHRWFLHTFPNPTAWYSARECYARTSAVMSMVGYVLGLGDRHTENILFDSTTGGVVHVDFSCVFNNGLTLPWPERVPFRLTRNMVHALGPTGYEGIFRRCSEAVMRLLRREIDPLLAVFRPIYFDALVEQDSNTRGLPADSHGHTSKTRRVGATVVSNASHDVTERVARAATEKLTGMEDRLHGKITEHDGFSQILPMSAEGQVDALISEATDVDQLCQMYKGWMPFL